MTITNTGKIIGDIFLGMGADTIDTRKGVVKGEIEGGYGEDTYIISNAKTKIIEGVGDSTVNCPPFRPDTRHKQEGSSTGLRTGLCLTSIDALK